MSRCGTAAGSASRRARSPAAFRPMRGASMATLVKAGALRGESKEQLKEIARAAQQESTDEVEQELISRSSQQAVKGYFGSMEQDAAQ